MKQLKVFCIILLLFTTGISGKTFPSKISNDNNKYNFDLLNIKVFALADTNYGRHQSMVHCIKSYIKLNKERSEFVLKEKSQNLHNFLKATDYFDGSKASEDFITRHKKHWKSLDDFGAIFIPEDPKKWTKSHLIDMATNKTGFDEGFGCLILLYNSAIATDKNRYFTEDANLARKALFNEFTPVSLSAQSKIDEIIYQHKNNKITRAEAIPKLVEIREAELNTFMNIIKEVAIETKEKRQELKNLNEKKN